MNPYRVVWHMGPLDISGKVEAESVERCLTRAREVWRNVLGSHPRDPVVTLIKRDSDKQYVVKTTYHNHKTGETRSYRSRPYKSRAAAEGKAQDSRGVYIGTGDTDNPESETTAEVVEVAA